MAYEALFRPIKVGSVTLKNRIIHCAMGNTSLLGFDYELNESIRDYYIERAKGGVGLIIPGVIGVKSGDRYLSDYRELFMTSVKDIIDEIHSYGTKYFIQLGAGFGRAMHLFPDMDKDLLAIASVAPSDGLPNVWSPEIKHRALSREEIKDIIRAYGTAAAMCKDAGIDGVEIHAVHEGYLLDQFAVAATNQRTDEYGGSLENRLRFACEVIREIKRCCGEDFPVSVRYSVASKMRGFNAGALPAENYREFGRTMEESPAAAQLLEAAGADMLNADNGSYDSWWWAHPPVYMPLHCNFPEVSYIKKFVNIPVFCAGRMEDPEFADKVVSSGEIDGIGVARQFLTDPHWINKVREGRMEDIKPCIACHNGCFPLSTVGPLNGRAMAHCALNPATREEAHWRLTSAETQKRIAVVGGGVGGMECAQLLAKRGHNVTLFEKMGKLGGAFIAAAAPSFKEKDKMLICWYIRQLKKQHVEIRMNCEADAELLADYDEIVVATGAAPRKLKVAGLEQAGVVEAIEYLRGTKTVGKNVVIIGGGLTGIEIAYDLVLKGKKATVVEMLDNILQIPGLCAANSNMLREIIRYYNIDVRTKTALASVESADGKLNVQVNTANGSETIEADSVILSVGYVPNRTLAEQLLSDSKLNGKVHVIGDAKSVGNLMSVIYDAYELAYQL